MVLTRAFSFFQRWFDFRWLYGLGTLGVDLFFALSPDIAAAARATYEVATDAAGARGARERGRMQQRYGLEPCGGVRRQRLIDRSRPA